MNTPEQVINLLREVYTSNKLGFDMQVVNLISGDHNKELRRAIMERITGNRLPLSKCGMYAVSDTIKSHIEQYTLIF